MLEEPGRGHRAAGAVPGASPGRIAQLCRAAVARCSLDLRGRQVVTEAASGAYVVTSVLAALAGADVTALTRASRYGSVPEISAWTSHVAGLLGVQDRVQVVETLTPEHLRTADVVTNSGHLRPLDVRLLAQLRPTAVVPLMMEAWEIGAGRVDVDLDAMSRRAIAFAGTNERHPSVGVFDFLGVMAVKLLVDAGVAVHACHVALLCDNPFLEHVRGTLLGCGATVTVVREPEDLADVPPADAVLVSLTPADEPRLRREHLALLAHRMPTCVVAQLYGDVDRAAAADLGVSCWPPSAPPAGHMGILPSAIGPDPVVRLQAGGLKVAQVLLTPPDQRSPADEEYLDVL